MYCYSRQFSTTGPKRNINLPAKMQRFSFNKKGKFFKNQAECINLSPFLIQLHDENYYKLRFRPPVFDWLQYP